MQMKRIKVAGLCLVAAFAFSAAAVSTAQAGEYGKCIELKAENKLYHGYYTGKGCEEKTKVSEAEKTAGGKKNKYEWEPTPVGSKIPYTSTGKSATLEGEAGDITCKKNVDEGEITGPKTDKDKVKFEECTLSLSKEACWNTGTPTSKGGTIETFTDNTKLIDHGEKGLSGDEPAEGEVWTEFYEEEETTGFTGPGHYLAAFECYVEKGVSIPFEVEGSVSGVNNAKDLNKMGTGGEVVFGKGKGEQDLTTIYYDPITKEVTAGASTQNANDKTKYGNKEKLEIRS
jgi:hypothetical protein